MIFFLVGLWFFFFDLVLFFFSCFCVFRSFWLLVFDELLFGEVIFVVVVVFDFLFVVCDNGDFVEEFKLFC